MNSSPDQVQNITEIIKEQLQIPAILRTIYSEGTCKASCPNYITDVEHMYFTISIREDHFQRFISSPTT